MLKDDIENSPKKPLVEVEAARNSIIALAKALAATDQIVLVESDDYI